MGKGKRASFVQDKVAIIIIIALVLIGILIILMQIFYSMGEAGSRAACKNSLQMSAIKLEGLSDRYGNPVKINCKTEYLKINTKEDSEIQREVANKMVDCWNMYLKGEKEIFNTDNQTYCVVCSRLEFTKQTEIPNFVSYLGTENVPGQKQTYLEYLQGVKVVDYQSSYSSNTELESFDKLSTKEPLAVMFVMSKNAFPDAKLGEKGTKVTATPEGFIAGGGTMAGVAVLTAVGTALAGAAACSTVVGCFAFVGVLGAAGGATGGVIGYVIGSERTADWSSYVTVYPYDKIEDMDCTYLEGKSGSLEIQEIGEESEEPGGN